MGPHQVDFGDGEIDPAVDRFGGESEGFEEGDPFAPGCGLFEPNRRVGFLGEADRDRFPFGRDPHTPGRLVDVRDGEGDLVADRIAGRSAEQVALASAPAQLRGVAAIAVKSAEESLATGDSGRQPEPGSQHTHQRPGGGECVRGEAAAQRVDRAEIATVPHRDVDG